jgi:hypothetical protein
MAHYPACPPPNVCLLIHYKAFQQFPGTLLHNMAMVAEKHIALAFYQGLQGKSPNPWMFSRVFCDIQEAAHYRFKIY